MARLCLSVAEILQISATHGAGYKAAPERSVTLKHNGQ